MLGDTFVQVFLVLQIIIMTALAALAARYAYAHFRPAHHEQPTPEPPPEVHLPPAVKEHLLRESEVRFRQALGHSTDQLQTELKVTSGHINNLVMRLATEIVSGELERYRSDLAQLHQQAAKDLGGISAEVAQHQAELKAKITQEMEAEKQRLIKQIDTKLADAVGSFLTETLQHNVDLGSQSAYLIAMLEEHKSDFIKEVADGTQTTP